MKSQQKQIHSQHPLRCFFSHYYPIISLPIIIRGAHSFPFFIDSNKFKELVRFKTFGMCYAAEDFVVLKGFLRFVLSVLGNQDTKGVLIWRGFQSFEGRVWFWPQTVPKETLSAETKFYLNTSSGFGVIKNCSGRIYTLPPPLTPPSMLQGLKHKCNSGAERVLYLRCRLFQVVSARSPF